MLQERMTALMAGGRLTLGTSGFGQPDRLLGATRLYEGTKQPFFVALPVSRPTPTPLPTHVVLGARLLQEFVEPALKQPTGEAFRAFWQKQLVPFRRVFHAYAVALETVLNTDVPTGDEADSDKATGAFIRAAKALAGAVGEEYARSAHLDMRLASETIDKFDDIAPQNAEEDGTQAARHNVGSMLHLAYGLSIVHVVEENLDLSSELITELVVGLNGWANMAFVAAKEGARLRGLSVDVRMALVHEVWQRPCEAMFTYLARRAPEQLGAYLSDQTLNAGLRARAAVAAKSIEDSSVAVPMLLAALNDPALIVQEGSVYGLERHLTPEATRHLREKLEDSTTDHAIRDAIQDALDLS